MSPYRDDGSGTRPRRSEPGFQGAETSFESFYESCHDSLYRALALVTGDTDMASEAVDEALARALERWAVVGAYDNPAAWVYRVALNRSRSLFGRRRREVSTMWSEPAVEDRIPEPELTRCVVRLPFRYRNVVVCRYLLDWSTTETAAALGLPENTVKTHLARALIRLRRELGEV